MPPARLILRNPGPMYPDQPTVNVIDPRNDRRPLTAVRAAQRGRVTQHSGRSGADPAPGKIGLQRRCIVALSGVPNATRRRDALNVGMASMGSAGIMRR